MDENYGNMVAMAMARSNMYRLETWQGKLKTVDPNDQMIKEAKRIGISFGD